MGGGKCYSGTVGSLECWRNGGVDGGKDLPVGEGELQCRRKVRWVGHESWNKEKCRNVEDVSEVVVFGVGRRRSCAG